MRVLLIDDEPDLVEQAKLFLERESEELEVETALSGEEGLKLYENNHFDAIVSDYKMRKMDGLELLKILRDKKNSRIPFIIFTGKGREDVAMKALNLGANRYLQKRGDPKAQYGVLAKSIEQEVNSLNAEKEIEKSEKKFRDLAENSIVGTYIIQDDVFKYVNPEFCKIFGYSKDKIIGMKFTELVAPEDREIVKKQVKKRQSKNGKPNRYKFHGLNKKGEKIPLKVSSIPFTYNNNPAIQGTILRRDDFEEPTDAYKRFFEKCPHPGMILSRDGCVSQVNNKLLEKWNFKKSNILDTEINNISDFYSQNKRKEIANLVDETIASSQSQNITISVQNEEQTEYVLVKSIPLKFSDSNFVGLIFVNITPTEETEGKMKVFSKDLKKRIEALETINSIANSLHTSLDSDKVAEKAVDVMKDYTGSPSVMLLDFDKDERIFTRLEACGFLEEEVSAPPSLSIEDSLSGEAVKKDSVVVSENIAEDDRIDDKASKVLIEEDFKSALAIPIKVKDTILGAIVLNFKEKYIPNDLEKETLASIGQTIGLALDNAQHVEELNKEIKARKEAEVELKESKERFELLFRLIPDLALLIDKDGYINEINRKAEDIFKYIDEDIVDKHLSELPFSSEETRERVLKNFKNRIQGRDVDPYTIKFRDKNSQIRYGEVNATLLEKDDEKKGILGIIRDITKRKKAEDREKFLHSLLRHDLRNKNQMAKGYLELLKEQNLPEKAEEYIDKTERTISEGADLIHKVRTLRKLEEEKTLSQVNVYSILNEAIDEYKDRAQENNFEIVHEKFDFKVTAGPFLKELFSNIIENCLEHSEGSLIKISGKETENEYQIIIEDDGKGVPDDYKEKVFEREFKKGKTAGSGLGLYMVKQIAESYNGRVELLDSELGGARFEIYLPKN